MKFPINGQWKVNQQSDRGLEIYATKNIQFDVNGYATLSPRTINMFDTDDNADFNIPLAAYYASTGLTKVITSSDVPLTIDISDDSPAVSKDALANQPTLTINSSAVMFNNKWTVTESADIKTFDGTSWTDETPATSPTSNKRHPLCINRAGQTLLMGNGNVVQQYSTAFAVAGISQLTIPAGLEVVGIAYNRSLAAIITWDSANGEGWLFIWDMATSAANYSYPLGSNRAHFVVGFKDTFVLMTGVGELLGWTATGLEHLAALPCFYTTAVLADIDDRLSIAHDTCVLVSGDVVLFNISTQISSKNSEKGYYYNNMMPSGIWCYDPPVGMYHRSAPAGAKMLYRSLVESGITANVVTVTATVPATGTPAIYYPGTGGITELDSNQLVYVIKVSSTTFKIAETREDALAGTNMTLTVGGGGGSLGFRFLPESDFGQLWVQYGGMLQKTGPQQNASAFSELAYGVGGIMKNSVSTDVDSLGIDLNCSENRGWIITQKLFSPHVTDTWNKLILKVRNLVSEHDKVIVKSRYREDPTMPVFATFANEEATWVDENTFTTTKDLTDVETAFNAGRKYEVEFVAGAGAGYLAHIAGISEAGGTWTVNIDEDVRNIAANDTAYFVIDSWEKLFPGAITKDSEKDFTEFEIGGNSKWSQLKFELRGRNVAIEEYEIVNTPHKES